MYNPTAVEYAIAVASHPAVSRVAKPQKIAATHMRITDHARPVVPTTPAPGKRPQTTTASEAPAPILSTSRPGSSDGDRKAALRTAELARNFR
jgi:hypothetical protein